MYYINETTGDLELVGNGPLTVSTASTVSFTLSHASSYVMSDKEKTFEVEGVTLNKTSMNVIASKTAKLTATISPANATDKTLTWASSDEAVATVDANGTVKGIKAGTAVITVTTANGKKAECKVTVTKLTIAAPKNVKAVSASYNSMKLTWSKSTNATTYYIYRATSKSGKYSRIATAKTTNYTDKKLSPGKTYYYKLKAGSGKTYSGYSAISSAYPRPAKVSVSAKAGSKSVTLTWKKVTGATGYTVYRATSKNGKYTKVKTITNGSTVKYTNKSLTKGKTYYYKVRANRKISTNKTIQSVSSSVVYAKAK
ncbi:MAG: Ig-like domain-containing protein, partial [Lachnospiraceae bacterium]|nr:Ig-like domain-containing protein [Lachnospiraceae bacterium]